MKKNNTSWGEAADWYQSLLSKEGTYQKNLILPNLLRLLEVKKGEKILDLACGQGFFAMEFAKLGALVWGTDISKELILLAKNNLPASLKNKTQFFISPAEDLKMIKNQTIDKAVIILAIQNIDNAKKVFEECSRVLKPGGKLFIVMNHPAFRIPKESNWGWDPLAGSLVPSWTGGQAGQSEKGVQYRRVDQYLSESKVKIQMHPGENPNENTVSFHRPLQFYFKLLNKAGFCVSRLEEWNSNKKSEPGPRAEAENRARKEIPLFLFLEAVKNINSK